MSGARRIAIVGAESTGKSWLVTALAEVFTLGVASGEPQPESVVLWTRLAPRPLQADGGMPERALPVQWEVALDARFTQVVRQGVAVARAAAFGSKVVIMDEPTASLSERETEKLFAVVRSLRESGVGIIYISHRLDEVMHLADRVTVFRDGRHVLTRPIAELDEDRIIAAGRM